MTNLGSRTFYDARNSEGHKGRQKDEKVKSSHDFAKIT